MKKEKKKQKSNWVRFNKSSQVVYWFDPNMTLYKLDILWITKQTSDEQRCFFAYTHNDCNLLQ